MQVFGFVNAGNTPGAMILLLHHLAPSLVRLTVKEDINITQGAQKGGRIEWLQEGEYDKTISRFQF